MNKFSLVLRAAALVFAVGQFSFCQQTDAQTFREWRARLDSLNSEIKQHPRSADLRLKKAAVNIELDQWAYAIEEYGNVLRLEPQNLAALYYRAYALTHERLYAMARRDYEDFLALQPVNMEARLGLAGVCEKMGRETEARDQYNTVVQMFPDSAVAYAARAAYETAHEQFEVALYDWGEAIRRQPDNVGYVVSKADILIALFRKEEARQVLEDAISHGTPRGVLHEWLQKTK